MPLSSVAVGDPVQASSYNSILEHVNGTNGRAFFTASGTWSVPAGVQKFRVTLVGGGGRGRESFSVATGEDGYYVAGGEGGDAPMISAVLSGYDTGTTFAITVGAGGTAGAPTGGTTSFGTVMSSTGGTMPGSSSGYYYDAITPKGGPGGATFPSGQPGVFHANDYIARNAYSFGKIVGYGKGGMGGPGHSGYGGSYEHLHSPGPQNGSPGMVMIEW